MYWGYCCAVAGGCVLNPNILVIELIVLDPVDAVPLFNLCLNSFTMGISFANFAVRKSL